MQISQWKKGNLEVNLLANGINTDSFTLESNFPMWKIDDVGYSLQTIYDSAHSAYSDEDDEYWYNPFKAYRYNYPNNDVYETDNADVISEKRTCTWTDGFDKITNSSKQYNTKRFNIGKNFLLKYDPKNPRLVYQMTKEASFWGWNEDEEMYILPTLDRCLTNDTFTYGYYPDRNELAIRFFESSSGSLLNYLNDILPRVKELDINDRTPVRFYDNVTGKLYYVNGRIQKHQHKIEGNTNEFITSFDVLKHVISKEKEIAASRGESFNYDFVLYGTYKVNNTTRNLVDVCSKPYSPVLSSIGAWGDLTKGIINANNLNTSYITDSRLVLRCKRKASSNEIVDEYEILDSVTLVADTSTKEGTNLPIENIEELESILSHGIRVITEDVVYTPSFVINDKLSVGFPVQFCFTTDPQGIRSCEVSNYVWNKDRNGITFDVSLKSIIFNDSLNIKLSGHDLVIDGYEDERINPPCRTTASYVSEESMDMVPTRFIDFNDDYSLTQPYSVVNSKPLKYMSMTSNAKEKTSLTGEIDFGPVNLTSIIPVGENDCVKVFNTIPMQSHGEINFQVTRTYHCFVASEIFSDDLIITADFISNPIVKPVAFAKYEANIFTEKLVNNVDVSLPNGVTLLANMYDATKIYVKDEFNSVFNMNDAKLIINEILPNGKTSEFDLNEPIDDFVFIQPFSYNDLTGYSEAVIYISAKNKYGTGFNDAVVNFSFDLPADVRIKYNLNSTSWNVSYRTHLPPYLIQGIPHKAVESAKDPVIPENYDRINFPASPYYSSRMGWKDNYLFTNAEPLYEVVASAYIPDQLGSFTFSDVASFIQDEVTGMKTFLDFETSKIELELPTLISGHNEFSDENSENIYAGKFNVYKYTQNIESERIKNAKSWTKNAVNISAHCAYDIGFSGDNLTKHVVKIVNGEIVIE